MQRYKKYLYYCLNKPLSTSFYYFHSNPFLFVEIKADHVTLICMVIFQIIFHFLQILLK